MYTVQVTCDCDFEVDGVDFRIYDDKLWADGDECDDYYIRTLPKVASLETYNETVEIEISENDLQEARDYIATIND